MRLCALKGCGRAGGAAGGQRRGLQRVPASCTPRAPAARSTTVAGRAWKLPRAGRWALAREEKQYSNPVFGRYIGI